MIIIVSKKELRPPWYVSLSPLILRKALRVSNMYFNSGYSTMYFKRKEIAETPFHLLKEISMNKPDTVSSSFTIGTFAPIDSQDLVQANLDSLF